MAKRRGKIQAIHAAAERIGSEVARLVKGLDLYALRKTHISWARRLSVNPDSVKVQVGHGPRDIEERHYLDLVDAQASSQAVWDLLTGERTLDARTVEPARASIAVGYDMAGSNPLCNQLAGKAQFPTDKTGLSGTEALGRKEVCNGGDDGTRTRNPRIDSPAL